MIERRRRESHGRSRSKPVACNHTWSTTVGRSICLLLVTLLASLVAFSRQSGGASAPSLDAYVAEAKRRLSDIVLNKFVEEVEPNVSVRSVKAATTTIDALRRALTSDPNIVAPDSVGYKHMFDALSESSSVCPGVMRYASVYDNSEHTFEIDRYLLRENNDTLKSITWIIVRRELAFDSATKLSHVGWTSDLYAFLVGDCETAKVKTGYFKNASTTDNDAEGIQTVFAEIFYIQRGFWFITIDRVRKHRVLSDGEYVLAAPLREQGASDKDRVLLRLVRANGGRK